MTNRPRAAQVLREKIAGGGSADSFGARARQRRWGMFLQRFPDLASARVIDLGGTPGFWSGCPVRPAELTVVNLDAPRGDAPSWIEVIVGDACEAGSLMGSRKFDLVFSNSTIEHVGGHDRCQAFARSVLSLSSRHWIQTPYRYFPVEPHFVFPALQFLPVAIRQRIVARWPLSYTRSVGGTLNDPIGTVLSVELLSKTQLKYYFPASEIVSEPFFGLTKSIIAVR